MIPIAIEPTRLAYGVYCTTKSCSTTNSKEVVRFLVEMGNLFTDLEQHGLGIAVTVNLMREYDSQFPYAEFSGDKFSGAARAAISHAVRLYQLKRERWRVIHKYGSHEHEMDVSISTGVDDPKGMLTTDITYFEWLDLLGLVLSNKLPPFILRDSEATVFCADSCLIEATPLMDDAIAYVSPDLNSDCANQGLALWRLAYLIRDDGETALDAVPCSGTGTHSSMWDKTIQSLDNVPAMERSLLKELAALGLVEEICLLSFNQPRPAVSSPAIESLEVQQGTENVLKGLLRGKGKKQNAQQITLKLRGNYADLLKTAMGDGIDLPRLERLKQAIRHLDGKSGKPPKRSAS